MPTIELPLPEPTLITVNIYEGNPRKSRAAGYWAVHPGAVPAVGDRLVLRETSTDVYLHRHETVERYEVMAREWDQGGAEADLYVRSVDKEGES